MPIRPLPSTNSVEGSGTTSTCAMVAFGAKSAICASLNGIPPHRGQRFHPYGDAGSPRVGRNETGTTAWIVFPDDVTLPAARVAGGSTPVRSLTTPVPSFCILTSASKMMFGSPRELKLDGVAEPRYTPQT